MRKLYFVILAFFAIFNEINAQKFLDFYSKGNIVSSVRASDVDSLVAGLEKSKRSLDFYKDGEIFHHTLA